MILDIDMKQIEVHIKEKDKGAKDLTLFNLRDEVVNFLYRDTVANSTKSDLYFYLLLFFSAVRVGEVSFVEHLFDEALPKIDKLNSAFSSRKQRLKAGEYAKLKEEYGLNDIFDKDIFFVLSEAILDIEQIELQYGDIYGENEEITRVFKTLKSKYKPLIESSLKYFRSSSIQDDRYDEYGNYHDLSKSVYRTIRMRNSRNLDVNLQKYASVREIRSQSPVDLTIIQHIDPEIIIALWTKYQVAHYMGHLWTLANDSPIIAGALGNLIVEFVKWKRTNGARNRKDKRIAKERYEVAKVSANKEMEAMTMKLVDSVLDSKKRLEKEVDILNKKLDKALNKADKDKDEIKRLKARIQELENLDVETKIKDE